MTSGEQGRSAPDAEHYLDLSGVEEDSPGPQFDVVLRGYDRKQVDEHVAGLRRMVGQLRAQLSVRERRRAPETAEPAAPERPEPATPAPRAAPLAERGVTPEDEARDPDMVGAFNDRLRGILQAAEQEAQLVRSKAAESLLAEHAESRAALADLRAQRDAVVDELVRLRGWLDEVVSHPGRHPGPPPGPARPAPRTGQPGPPRPGAPGVGPGTPMAAGPSFVRPPGPTHGPGDGAPDDDPATAGQRADTDETPVVGGSAPSEGPDRPEASDEPARRPRTVETTVSTARSAPQGPVT